MHFSTILTIALAIFAGTAMARIDLSPLPSTLNAGDVHNVNWTIDRPYDLDLYLVKQESNGWSDYSHVKKTFRQYSGTGRMDWQVPNVQENQHYALWLSGDDYPHDNHGYANLTNWFEIVGNGNWQGDHRPLVLNAGQIAGLVVGVVAAVCCMVAAVFFVVRKRRAHRAKIAALGESYERETAAMGAGGESRQTMSESSA